MERVSNDDNDETGTTSMISSLLGDDYSEAGYQPALPEIPETHSSRGSLYAYTGPGKIVDPSLASESRILKDSPVANKMMAVLGSIEKLKVSSHQSLKGSQDHINSRSNAAISTVIDALHTHDQTIKSLRNALNDIEIVTEESNMERKSPSKFSLSSIRQLNRSQRVLSNKKAEPTITKEWVQNEVEIQIEYLRKSLNIEQIQKVLLHLNKDRIEEKEYRAHIKELIKHEINDQVEEIKDSNQNLQVLDQVEDLMSSKNNQMQTQILDELQHHLRIILQDETEKIISTVTEKAPDYVTESTLKLAIQEALLNANNKENIDNAVIEKMNQLNQIVELLGKDISQINASKIDDKLEARISKLEELRQKSNDDILQKKIDDMENYLQQIFYDLDLKTKTQEQHQSEINKLINTDTYYKREVSSKIMHLENNLTDNSVLADLGHRMSVLENHLKEISTQLSIQSEKYENTNKNGGMSESWHRLVLDLEDRVNELQTKFDSPAPKISEDHKENIAVIAKNISQLDKIVKDQISEIGTTKNTLSEIATQLSIQSEKYENTNKNGGMSESWHRLVLDLEDRVNELQTKFDSPAPKISEDHKENIAVIAKNISQLDKIVKDQISEIGTTKNILSLLSKKSNDQEHEISGLPSIQSRLSFIETELSKKNAENHDSALTARMTSIIDSRIAELRDAKIENDFVNFVSNTMLQDEITALKLCIDSKLSEYENVKQNYLNKKTAADNFEIINKNLADVSKKVDILNSGVGLLKESAVKSKEDSKMTSQELADALAHSDLWIKVQDQISQLSDAAIKISSFEPEIREDVSQVKSIKNEIDYLKKTVEKHKTLLMDQQNQQSSLDVNTRLSVLTSRIMDVETRSKTFDNVNLADISQDIQAMKQNFGRFDNLVKTIDEKVLSAKRQTFETETINHFTVSQAIWESAQLKIADVEALVKTNINPAIRKLELEHKHQGECLRTMDNNIKSLQEDKSSAQIEAWITSHSSKLRQELEVKIENKVDNDVLEELIKHLVTRDELKKVVKKKLNAMSERSSIENIRANERIKSNIQDELDENRNIAILHKKLKKELEAYLSDQIKILETRLQAHESFFTNEQSGLDMEKKDMQSLKRFAETLINDKLKLMLNSHASHGAKKEGDVVSDDEIELLEQKMRREFDEKLFMLCSEFSSCKSMIASQLSEPFHRCAQWIWKSGHLKLGSAVPWNIQTLNTDEENFQWEQDSFNIKVAEAGLYEITMAFFTKTKPSIQLVVNGDSIMSAINSPSYIVHHSSGYVIDGNGKMQEGVVSGLSLVDFLALPSKSTISIHYHGVKKQALGHGFLGLRKL